jgi:hypothetical protein
VVTASIDGTTGALLEEPTAKPTSSPRTTASCHGQGRRRAVAKNNPADVAALGALPYSQDGFGPTLEDVRKGLIGKIGENMTSAASSATPAPTSWPPTCTARASAWSSSSRATSGRQGRGHARARDEAVALTSADVRPS